MPSYAIVNSQGAIINIVEWDGSSSWKPPAGMTAVLNTAGADMTWTYANSQFVAPTPPTPPTPTPDQVAAAKIAAGCQITSTSITALDGTYAIDPATQSKVQAVALYIQVNGRFPAGQTALAWPDLTGTPHAFPTTASFLTFATALGDYVTALDLTAAALTAGQQASWPAQPSAIP